MIENYKKITEHYEKCLEKFGDNHLGMDWPNPEDVDKRYKVMLDIIRIADDQREQATLLDFGCGTAHIVEFIKKNQFRNIVYSGLDISAKSIELAKAKYPETIFYCADVLNCATQLPRFDYIIMNGVFTEKRELSYEEMWRYFSDMIKTAYDMCDKGLAFNVMSKNVDWEREDLFHVSLDVLSDFLCQKLTRNFIIRNDYGLYEYTTYILKR